MAATPKKKRKGSKTTFKQKAVTFVVIAVPALIVIVWIVLTVIYNQPPK